MIIQDEGKLRMWISHVVEDISDAEPDALAKYVIALVKKPHSDADLEKLCSEKLSVFLQTHTEDFVVRLFATLKSGDYLTHKSSIEEKVKKQEEVAEHEEKPEDAITAETDELVLTDPEPESEHELEPSPTEKVPPKKTMTPSKSKEPIQHAKSNREIKPPTRTESSRPSKEDSRKLTIESTRKAAPTSPAPAPKPPRKRISPPRSTSAERRAERRQSPIRRRVIVGNVPAGGGVGLRVQSRHYRDARRAVRSKSRSRSPHIRKEKRPDLRRRCRDFHEKGFCMRGDACPYDHGPDPVVVEDSALEKMVRTGTVFDPASAYGVNPPPPGMESTASTGNMKSLGNVAEGYNPEAPALTTPSVTVTRIDFSVPPPPIPQMVQRNHLPTQMIYPPGTVPPTSILQPYSSSAGLVHIRPAQENAMSLPVQTTTIYGPNPTGQIGTFGGIGNGMLMRGGRFKPYSLANRNPASRSLLVKKVPTELNKIAQLDQHFSKFGQVTNVQVQYEGRLDTALVTFKTRRDAMMAYKSTEPIFNNRFIKVFWQNDMQAQTADGDGIAVAPESATNETIGTESGSGPTIPLSTGVVVKSPRIMPRYFTKTFAKPTASVPAIQQQQPTSEPNMGEVEAKPTTTTAEIAQTTITEIAATSSGSVPEIAPPIQSQAQPRPIYAGARVAAMKRKTDKEKLGKLMELHKMKADLYAELVDQQKMLLQKLKNTEDKEQKKKLMEFLKKTEGPAKKVKIELEELGTKMREVQQQRQMVGPRKRRMSLITGQQSSESGQAGTENGATISSPKPSSPNKKLFKLCRIVYVSNCPQEHGEKLIIHMEKFGDLFDYDINTEPHMFTYKNPVDAQKAVAEAVGSFAMAKLHVEWAPTAKNVKNEVSIIPDRERKPSEQVTPKDLLASLDYDEDEEEGENATKEEESEEAEVGEDD